ncbi:MAG TPA: SpoIIE family protein phosphatase, partial [Anaerolineae bacterium]
DGVTEARNADLEFFGAERLRTTLHAALPASAQAACDAVFGAIQSFSGNAAQQDDITLVAVQAE